MYPRGRTVSPNFRTVGLAEVAGTIDPGLGTLAALSVSPLNPRRTSGAFLGASSMGLLDGIGQLLDPAGILSSNDGQQSGLNKIFDPLGLFPAIKGEVDKSMHPDGANGRTDAKAGASKLMELYGTGKDIAQQFQSSDPGGTTADDSTKTDPGTTEQSPPSDQAGAGYAAPDASQSQQSSVQGDSEPQPVSDASAMTAQDANAPVSSTYAATAVPPEVKEELDAMQTLKNYFSAYKDRDGFDHDGWADTQNLDTVISRGDQPADLVKAAQWLKEHPEAFELLVGLSGSTNGSFSLDGLDRYMSLREAAALAQQPASASDGKLPTQGSTGSTTGNAPPTSVPGQYLPPNGPPVLGGADPPTNSAGSAPPPSPSTASDISNVPRSFDELIQNFDQKLDAMDEHIRELGMKAANGDKSAEAEMTSLTRQYQGLMELRQEMHTLLSDIMKDFHDMSMHAIGNIRS
jgi:hypothetical protein